MRRIGAIAVALLASLVLSGIGPKSLPTQIHGIAVRGPVAPFVVSEVMANADTLATMLEESKPADFAPFLIDLSNDRVVLRPVTRQGQALVETVRERGTFLSEIGKEWQVPDGVFDVITVAPIDSSLPTMTETRTLMDEALVLLTGPGMPARVATMGSIDRTNGLVTITVNRLVPAMAEALAAKLDVTRLQLEVDRSSRVGEI